jgi:hypothetical protein
MGVETSRWDAADYLDSTEAILEAASPPFRKTLSRSPPFGLFVSVPFQIGRDAMPALAHVAAAYAQYPKRAVPRGTLGAAAAELKFYHVEKAGEPVPAEIADSARAFLASESGAAAGLDGDCGFAILHRCGADFYFLLIGVWRGSNEIWEAVWYRDGGMEEFAPFGPAYPIRAGGLRPTFCVWEMGVVAHESAAWTRFLASARGAADLERWRADMLAGEV